MIDVNKRITDDKRTSVQYVTSFYSKNHDYSRPASWWIIIIIKYRHFTKTFFFIIFVRTLKQRWSPSWFVRQIFAYYTCKCVVKINEHRSDTMLAYYYDLILLPQLGTGQHDVPVFYLKIRRKRVRFPIKKISLIFAIKKSIKFKNENYIYSYINK